MQNNENAVIDQPSTEVIEKVKIKIPLIPTPVEPTRKEPLILKFHVGKEHMRKMDIPQVDERKKPTQVYSLFPRLSEWQGRLVPDSINPRSHDASSLKSPVAKQIEATIMERPEDFFLANRGITLVAESLEFDPKTGMVAIKISDPDKHGLADGASSDSVIARVQTRFAREILEKKDATWQELVEADKIPEVLKNARVHVEVLIGLDNRFRLSNLVEGRNTSRQVKSWSLSDFRGAFDWLKLVLESDPNSPVRDKIGYEENSNKDISILDILAILTLFHPEYDEKNESGITKSPVIGYASRGRLDQRLLDEKLSQGYKELGPLIIDIIKLHDFIYSGFEKAYDSVFGEKARLGRREGVRSCLLEEPYVLEMTGTKSNYEIPSGYIYPLLASFRALITRRGEKIYWKVDPFGFWDKYGKDLVSELMEQVKENGGKPNSVGKSAVAYSSLHKCVKIALSEELEERREAKEKNRS